MNITAIQTFLAVIRTRNLNRAAEALNITQSAVTARLDALECSLGAKLLIRSRKGAELTKAGFAFLEKAELIARTWEGARARTSLPEGVTRLFSLACDPVLWAGVGETWMAELREDHPDIAIEIWTGLAGDARRWLQSGMCDAALLGEPLNGVGLESRDSRPVTITQFATRARAAMRWDPNYVMVDYGPAFRTWHSATWPGDDTAAVSFSSPDWALRHLLAHGGSAYLPASMGMAVPDLHPVEGAPDFALRNALTWRLTSAQSFPFL